MGEVNNIQMFNSPLEIGLRILFIFNNTKKQFFDKQRLIYYNYLLVHSSDIPNSPPSLHPALPNHTCEIFVGGDLISNGLGLLLAKDLLCVKYEKSGIKYKSNGRTKPFTHYFASDYAKEINERAEWVCKTFDEYSDQKLTQFMKEKQGTWGSEFSAEYRIMGELSE